MQVYYIFFIFSLQITANEFKSTEPTEDGVHVVVKEPNTDLAEIIEMVIIVLI